MSNVVKLADARPMPEVETKSRQAARARRNAGIERRLARHAGLGAADQLAEAERFETIAAALMKPTGAPTVKSGEVVAAPDEAGPASEIADTLRNPDQAAIDASVKRTELLLTPAADLVALAVDAAASFKADNSLEKMLAHQLAVIHVLAMKTGTRALEFEKRQGAYGEGFAQADSVELGRLSNAMSRLSSTFQEGLLTMQRLRSGSSQTVTVRHITVQAGAQAVIGNVKAGGKGRRVKGRGKPSK
jgi:hypothetical protein